LAGKTDPQSVVISPADYIEPICEPLRVADEIVCNNLNVYCRDPTDDIVLRIVAAGEILMHQANCAELVSAGFDYVAKNAALGGTAEEYAEYEAGLSIQYEYEVERDQHDLPAGAKLNYEYGTFIESQELICFTGDFFPFNSPSCQLFMHNGGDRLAVNTQIHNANEYQIDDSVIELVVNDGAEEEVDQDFNVYSSGAPLAIDAALEEAIRGTVDVDYIDQAVPQILEITGEPSCGVLTKSGTGEFEQTFALFWSYTVE